MFKNLWMKFYFHADAEWSRWYVEKRNGWGFVHFSKFCFAWTENHKQKRQVRIQSEMFYSR